MKIAFTHNLRASDPEEETEFDRPETVRAIADALHQLGHEVDLIEVSGSFSRTIARLESFAPDLVFNTAKGYAVTEPHLNVRGRLREAFYPAVLDRLGLPFTGSGAHCCTLTRDKRLTKLLANEQGILTPRFVFVDDVRSLATAKELAFPVIVKPNDKGRSKSISRDSVVDRAGDLPAAVETLLARYPDGVLVEELIAGRDVSVSYLEGAIRSLGGILEPKEEIAQRSRKMVRATGVLDFGRIDFRLGDDGKLYFLEVNAFPSLEAGAPIYLSAKAAGIESMAGVLGVIIGSASARFGIPERIEARAKARRKGFKVGLTFNLKRVASTVGGEVDQDAEYDSPKVIAAVRGAIESYGHEVVELEATPELPAIIGSAGVDVVFNMAEGLRGRNREAQVPAILELLDIPYSGSDAATMSLALDKALAKRVVAQGGILTAPFMTMITGEERLPQDFQFPAIVKPVAEGSSKGVLKTSVVENEAELRALVNVIIEKYRQAALVEEFLSGREFTVALLGEKNPRVLPPMEIVFINKETKRPVYAFDHKLDWSTEIRYDHPAQVDPALGAELERVAKSVFFALGCRDLARVDLRLDGEGRVNFIEINPLPGLSPGWSDLCLIAESAGMDYRGLIGEILAPCLERHRRGDAE